MIGGISEFQSENSLNYSALEKGMCSAEILSVTFVPAPLLIV